MGAILIILILIFIGLIIKVAIDSFDKASKDKIKRLLRICQSKIL